MQDPIGFYSGRKRECQASISLSLKKIKECKAAIRDETLNIERMKSLIIDFNENIGIQLNVVPQVCSNNFIWRAASSINGAHSALAAFNRVCSVCCQLSSVLMGITSVYKPYSCPGFSLSSAFENSRLFGKMITRPVYKWADWPGPISSNFVAKMS